MKKLICKPTGQKISTGLDIHYDILDDDKIIGGGFTKNVEAIKQHAESGHMKEELDGLYPEGYEIVVDVEC